MKMARLAFSLGRASGVLALLALLGAWTIQTNGTPLFGTSQTL